MDLKQQTLEFTFNKFSELTALEKNLTEELKKLTNKLKEVMVQKEHSYKKYRNELIDSLKLK